MKSKINENILLIGAAGDIGREIFDSLKNCGYQVEGTTKLDLDLSDKVSIKKFLSSENNSYNHIILAAAVNKPKDFLDINDEDLNSAININFLSYLTILKSLIPKMHNRTNSSIIFISSLYAITGKKGRLPYSASKHGMMGTIKTLALEIGNLNIRVNAISPGFINTKMTRNNISKKNLIKLQSNIPLNRLGNPKDIVNAVKFLISKDSNYISGTNIIVDGGYISGGFHGD